ncbi:LysE family translocator [Actinoallomurus soli]|uniref:LysE family translocator n=1 Tax=Actinoallomurus soli TaxID=2952535 RepID=UPI0020920403|nr:LysE family translocator [Actinoallomurus soli]MCO5970461.1 LysE family translocator [Actinoallomurus soli]
MWQTLGPYLGLCLLITITPGLDTAVVIRNVLKGGTWTGLATALGCALGLFVHAVAVALGLAGLLLRSETTFEAVKLTGAVFLLLLGLRSLWSAWRGAPPEPEDVVAERAPRRLSPRSPLAQGLLTNLTNPKASLFFLATLPQFIPADRAGAAMPLALGLATIAVAFSLTGLSLIALGLGRVRRWLNAPRFHRAQEGMLGMTLVALGLRVALE